MQLALPLSTLQYGQSRDINLRFTNSPTTTPLPDITASLTYHLFTPTPHTTTTSSLSPPLPAPTTAFHTSRSLLLSFLSTLSPLRPLDLEHIPAPLPPSTRDRLASLLSSFPAAAFPSDPACVALTQDVAGQVSLAISTAGYYHRWGKHFLPSLGGAHASQVCNSFKDPGPMVYGGKGGVFERCRDALDRAFDGLEAPVPSRKGRKAGGGHGKVVVMSAYNRSSNPCFAGCGMVEVEGGRVVRIGRLRRGVRVVTPRGVRRVVAVLRTVVGREGMCLVGGAVVTPWHPVRVGGGGWVFPVEVKRREVRYTGAVYSVLLERDGDADAHAICVDGVWGVTLGHGKTGADGRVGDVRAHGFLGDYDRVVKSLGVLHRSRSGLVLGGGVKRDPRTGLVVGFKRASAEDVKGATKKQGKTVTVRSEVRVCRSREVGKSDGQVATPVTPRHRRTHRTIVS